VNWEAIGALGELMGAVGVIISLLYVASQLRHYRVAMKTASSIDGAASFRSVTAPVMASPQLTGTMLRGLEDPASLDDDERAWLVNIVFNALRVYETIHFQYESGTVDKDLFRGYSLHLRTYLDAPLVLQYWERRRHFFSSRFQKFVDGLLQTSGQPGVRVPELVRRIQDDDA